MRTICLMWIAVAVWGVHAATAQSTSGSLNRTPADTVLKTMTGPNQVITLGPELGAHNTFLPTYPGSVIHDLVPGYEGARYFDCLFQGGAHGMVIADTNACAWNHATFDAAPASTVPANNQMLRLDSLYSFGKSANYSSDWRVVSMHQDNETIASRGIAGGYNIFYQKNAAGDSNVLNLYSWFDSGWNDQSGEGMTGIRNYVQQMPLWYHGTSLSAGTGLPLPLLSDYTGPPVASSQTYDPNHTIDGGILLDISKGTLSGTISGPSAPLPGSGYLNTYPTGGGLPVTTAWGICPVAIPNSYQPQVNVPFTCTITLKAGAFKAGGLVWVAGPNYPEQAPITAVGPVTGGTQSITISVRNPQPTPGANIFQSSPTGATLQGQYLSLDANLAAASGIRTTYYAFGSLDGTNLIYGFFIQGGSIQMLDCGSQAFCPGVPERNGFHLYPGAEIIANHSIHHDVELEPNAMTLAVGDQLEGPPSVSVTMTGSKMQCSLSTPANGGGSFCDYVGVTGPGLNGNFYPHITSNFWDPAVYAVNGGYLTGMMMHRIRGYFDIGENFDIMPGRALFNVANMNFRQAAGAGGFAGVTSGILFNLPHGRVSWDDLHSVLTTENLGSLTYRGPAVAPSGACTADQVGQWQFTQDGHISFCAPSGSAGVWVIKI